MARETTRVTRRTFLEGAIILPALAVAAGGVAAADASKAPQAQMHYQSTPSGNMHCAICKFFVAGKDASSNGSCQIVDGSISPNGYCMAYSPKSS